MEALEQQITISPKRLSKTLQADEMAYVASVGKHNKAGLSEITSNASGEGTVLRLFFGATTEMPLRGLSYVTAAAQVAEYIPHEQLQVIFVNNLGNEINGINIAESRREAERVAVLCRNFLRLHKPHLAESVLFGEDVPTDAIEGIQPAVGEMIAGVEKLNAKLSGKGSKHGGDYIAYSAAHIVYQEMAGMNPAGLTCEEPEAITPERILSIGCQQEHPFYAVRMAAREMLTGMDMLPTGQVFTKHLLPPYYMARGGEQSLEAAMINGVDLSATKDLSARRDINYLLSVVDAQEIQDEI